MKRIKLFLLLLFLALNGCVTNGFRSMIRVYDRVLGLESSINEPPQQQPCPPARVVWAPQKPRYGRNPFRSSPYVLIPGKSSASRTTSGSLLAPVDYLPPGSFERPTRPPTKRPAARSTNTANKSLSERFQVALKSQPTPSSTPREWMFEETKTADAL